MRVSIITEGFQNTGYGHITRCLSLYQAFEEKNFNTTFFVNGDENAEKYLAGSNYKIINWLTHPTKLISEISGSDILIIDSYHAGKEYYETLSKLCKVSLYIDDYIRLEYPAGIILNGTINAETFNYKKNPVCEYLLGVKYIPIRKEFWNAEPRKINQNISSVLITYGGQDVRNLTAPTFRAIQNSFAGINKKIVLGGDANKKEFEKLKDEYTEIFYSISADKMRDLMLSCDVAISAAGQTLYELAITGTPTIAVAVADNQRDNILEWKKSGFLLDTIFHGDSNYLKKITEQLNSMKSVSVRKKLSAKGKAQVDGQGSRRAVKYLIEKFCANESFYFRKANIRDSKIVFELSNDPEVREQSINKNQIAINDHENWFTNKIEDKNYLFLLAFDKNEKFIGQVRFQIEADSAVISISITKDFRGKGFSKKMLIDGCAKLFSEHNSVKNIIAYILPGNHASVKSFLSAGFEYKENSTINDEVFSKYILTRNVK